MKFAFFFPLLAIAQDSLSDYVNILVGTASYGERSNGNVLPFVARPWGFNYWANVAKRTDNWWDGFWFHPARPQTYGIRCTHQASPWVNDWGQFTIMPHTGGERWHYESGVIVEEATWKPYEFATDLQGMENDNGLGRMSITATSHAAVLKFDYPPLEEEKSAGWEQTREVVIKMFESESLAENGGYDRETYNFYSMETDGTGKTIVKARTTRATGEPVANFVQWIYIEFDYDMFDYIIDMDTEWLWLIVKFDTGVDTLQMHISTSLISEEQAILNFEEVKGRTYEQVRDESKQVWDDHLARIEINEFGDGYTAEEQEDIKKIFYSAMYRATLFPRSLVEIDAAGAKKHYSPYHPDGGVFDGASSTDSGYWDAYRTVYTFLGLVYPEYHTEVLNGYLTAFDEGGWVPQWATIGYKASMVSTMSDCTFADAIAKNVEGVDHEALYQAARKNAYVAPPPDRVSCGRDALEEYIRLGYVPADSDEGGSEAVSRSLDYYFSDWSLAQAAAILGHTEDAADLESRSRHWFRIWHEDKKLFVPKLQSGEWVEPFDQYHWSPHYTESGPEQNRFHVPQDPERLAEYYGGPEGICEYLDRMVTTRPVAHKDPNSETSHEMNSMFHDKFGQYTHSNQPVHHVLFMFSNVQGRNTTLNDKCLRVGQKHIRAVLDKLYDPMNYAGDEDNGEMAAWYILGTMGLYTMSLGTPNYDLGSPLFKKMTIHRPGKPFVIRGTGNCKDCTTVYSVRLRGEVQLGSKIDHNMIFKALDDEGEIDLEFRFAESEDDPDGDGSPIEPSAALHLTASLSMLFFMGLLLP